MLFLKPVADLEQKIAKLTKEKGDKKKITDMTKLLDAGLKEMGYAQYLTGHEGQMQRIGRRCHEPAARGLLH